MIGKKLKLVYSFCLLAALSACDKKDSAQTQDMKNQVRLAGAMAANIWCKGGGYYYKDRIEAITYQGLGKINGYSLQKKSDPRLPWGYRLVGFRYGADDKADIEYAPGAEFPAKDAPAGTPKVKMDIRPALRKNWQETYLSPMIPQDMLDGRPAQELVLRSRGYSGSEQQTVFHPCIPAGSNFVEFLNQDESYANKHFISQIEGRTLDARDSKNADRLLEIEWPVREFGLSSDYVISRKLCSVSSSYGGSVNVDVYTLQSDGSIRYTSAIWSNSKGTAKTQMDTAALSARVRWEVKNNTLRLFSRGAQPWDVIGGASIWVAKGYQDGSGRTLIYPRENERVVMTFQDCERFRNPTHGGMTFGPINLTGETAKDSFEANAALDTLYSDLNITKK